MSYAQPPAGAGPQYYYDEPPRRQKRRGVPGWLAVILAATTGVGGFVAGAAAAGSATSTTAAPPAGKASAPAASKRPAAAAVKGVGDGTYVVGEDIAPGRYRSKGGTSCYWARLRDLDGGVNSIIANNIAPGPQVVTIAKTDAAFETRGCADWVKS